MIKLKKAPFVCNGCPNKNKCKKNRYFYYAEDANNDYRRTLVESIQGIDLDKYSKEDIYLMMNHINNTKREKLNGNTPYNLMKENIREENIKKLGFYFISPEDIILKPSLFNKDNNK